MSFVLQVDYYAEGDRVTNTGARLRDSSCGQEPAAGWLCRAGGALRPMRRTSVSNRLFARSPSADMTACDLVYQKMIDDRLQQ